MCCFFLFFFFLNPPPPPPPPRCVLINVKGQAGELEGVANGLVRDAIGCKR